MESFSCIFQVKWAEQQVIKRRVKREYNTNFNDPLYTDQWYLVSFNK